MPCNSPQISIVMPVYNASKYLHSAIESILVQSFKDFEFICVYDKSSDNSVEILNEYKKIDERIIIIENKAQGIVGALNTGIETSKGIYIARMDADDFSYKERLKIQYEFMENNQNCILVCSNARIIDQYGRPVIKKVFNTNLNLPPLEWLMIWENPIIHPSVMIRKNFKEPLVNFYPNEFAEDAAFWRELSFYGKILRINQVLIDYRVSLSSLFHSNIEKNCTSVLHSNMRYLKNVLKVDSIPDYFFCFTSYYYFQKEIFYGQFISKKLFNNLSNKTINIFGEKFNYNFEEIERCKKYSKYLYLVYLFRGKFYLLFILYFIKVNNYSKVIFLEKIFKRVMQKLSNCYKLKNKIFYILRS